MSDLFFKIFSGLLSWLSWPFRVLLKATVPSEAKRKRSQRKASEHKYYAGFLTNNKNPSFETCNLLHWFEPKCEPAIIAVTSNNCFVLYNNKIYKYQDGQFRKCKSKVFLSFDTNNLLETSKTIDNFHQEIIVRKATANYEQGMELFAQHMSHLEETLNGKVQKTSSRKRFGKTRDKSSKSAKRAYRSFGDVHFSKGDYSSQDGSKNTYDDKIARKTLQRAAEAIAKALEK